MSKLKSLREKLAPAKTQRNTALDKLKEFRDKLGGENAAAFSEDDDKRFKAAKSEFDKLDNEVRNLESLIEVEERAASFTDDGTEGNPVTANFIQKRKSDNPDSVRQEYSVLKAIRSVVSNKPLEGREKEMQEEAQKEARAAGVDATVGQIFIPSFIGRTAHAGAGGPEARDVTAGTATAGGNLIPTTHNDLIPFLDPRTPIRDLGARFMSDLTGTVEFSRKTARAQASWLAENAAAGESSPTFDKVSLSPKRVATFTDLSLSLVNQISFGIENEVRKDLANAVANAIELAAINGSGTAPEPLGILNVPGIGAVAIGTNGGAPTYDFMVDLETAIAAANADFNTLGYLMTPSMRGKLKKTRIDSGSGLMVFTGANNGSGEVNGYRSMVSTLVPNNLVKGASTDCQAVIFGNWSELMIGQWAGLSIIVDPYTRAKEGMLVLTVNSWLDTAVRHAASFAAIKDARLV